MMFMLGLFTAWAIWALIWYFKIKRLDKKLRPTYPEYSKPNSKVGNLLEKQKRELYSSLRVRQQSEELVRR